jgi:LysR family transcriptional regulator, low CO2-responsive transcriptional regulator
LFWRATPKVCALLQQQFETAGVRPNIGMAMSSNETIQQAVIAGLGIAE